MPERGPDAGSASALPGGPTDTATADEGAGDAPQTSPPSDAPPDAQTELHTYVVFTVDTNGYALHVDRVRSVLPLPQVTRVPTEVPHVLGVFQYQGGIVALWDLHALFAADGPPPERPNVLVIDVGDHLLGLLVDGVDEVITLEHPEVVDTDAVLPPHVAGLVEGWLRADESEDRSSQDHTVDAVAEELPLHAVLAATGRPDRGAAVLALHAPVHLIDPDALWRLGSGREAPWEVQNGRS